MQWDSRKLTEDSWLRLTNRSDIIVRAGDIDPDDPMSGTHIDWVKKYPTTKMYRWPTELELVQHFGAQHAVERPGAD